MLGKIILAVTHLHESVLRDATKLEILSTRHWDKHTQVYIQVQGMRVEGLTGSLTSWCCSYHGGWVSSTRHFPHSVSMSSIAPCPMAFNARPLIWSLETRDNLQYQAFVDQTEEQRNKETKKNNNNILTVKKKRPLLFWHLAKQIMQYLLAKIIMIVLKKITTMWKCLFECYMYLTGGSFIGSFQLLRHQLTCSCNSNNRHLMSLEPW